MKHAISTTDSDPQLLATKLRTNGFVPSFTGVTGGTDAYGIYQRVGAVVMWTVYFPTGYTGAGYLKIPVTMDSKFAGCGVVQVRGYYATWGTFIEQGSNYLYPSSNEAYLPDPSGFTNYTAGGAITVSGWIIAG